MFYLLGSLFIGIVVGIIVYLFSKEDDTSLTIGVAVCLLSFFIFAAVKWPIINALFLQGEVTKEYKIECNENYYSISSNDKISISIVNEDGDCVAISYDKDVVKFEKGKEAKVAVTYKEYNWNDDKDFWFGLFKGTYCYPEDTATAVIITLPYDEYCGECDAAISADDIYCGKCGSKIIKIENIYCSNCGDKISEEDQYCSSCGNELK